MKKFNRLSMFFIMFILIFSTQSVSADELNGTKEIIGTNEAKCVYDLREYMPNIQEFDVNSVKLVINYNSASVTGTEIITDPQVKVSSENNNARIVDRSSSKYISAAAFLNKGDITTLICPIINFQAEWHDEKLPDNLLTGWNSYIIKYGSEGMDLSAISLKQSDWHLWEDEKNTLQDVESIDSESIIGDYKAFECRIDESLDLEKGNYGYTSTTDGYVMATYQDGKLTLTPSEEDAKIVEGFIDTRAFNKYANDNDGKFISLNLLFSDQDKWECKTVTTGDIFADLETGQCQGATNYYAEYNEEKNEWYLCGSESDGFTVEDGEDKDSLTNQTDAELREYYDSVGLDVYEKPTCDSMAIIFDEVNGIYVVFEIILTLGLFILTAKDFMGVIISEGSKIDEKRKKATSNLKIRLVILVLIFILPQLLNFILPYVSNYDSCVKYIES